MPSLAYSVFFQAVQIVKICFLLLVSSVLICTAITALADPVLQPNDRVALCGDAMSGGYFYLEDYLLMTQSAARLDIVQFTWSGQDPASLFARLNTDLLPFKPTVVLLDFNGGDVNTLARAQTDVVQALKKAGIRTIVIGSPECVDSTHYQYAPVKAAAQNMLLGALADIDKRVAVQEGVIYADIFGATMAAMTKAKAQNSKDLAVSPSRNGNRISLQFPSELFLKAGQTLNIAIN